MHCKKLVIFFTFFISLSSYTSEHLEDEKNVYREENSALVLKLISNEPINVKQLIKNDFDINSRVYIDLQDSEGKTALMLANFGFLESNKKIIFCLVNRGIDLTKRDSLNESFFKTPLGKKNKKEAQIIAQNWWNSIAFACKQNDFPTDLLKELSFFVYENPKKLGIALLKDSNSSLIANAEIPD